MERTICLLTLLPLTLLVGCSTSNRHPERFGTLNRLRLERLEEDLATLRDDVQTLTLESTRQNIRMTVLHRFLKAEQRSSNAWNRHQVQQSLLSLDADRALLDARRVRFEKILAELLKESGHEPTSSPAEMTMR